MMPSFPLIMGVLNITPDSFSDGGLYFSSDAAIRRGLQLIDDGADIIDVGGESTRPGAMSVAEDEELKRVMPVIEAIKSSKPEIKISIDSSKYKVVEAAIDAGAEIINDVTGLDYDVRIAALAAEHDLTLILMHMQGRPRTMQVHPIYNNVVEDVFNELEKKIQKARDLGVNKVIADVGIGFGKTYEHNIALLQNHREFLRLGVPLLLGISRKTFIGKMLNIEDPSQRDIPTALIHALLLSCGADIIRVHEVRLLAILKKIVNALSV